MAFTKDTFAYLADLKANNEKHWFDANRARYETHWKEAALDFIADIAPRMQALDPALRAEPKLNGSLRRINRDVRFSKDKSPYAPRLHLVFWTGDHPNRSPGMHLVLHATHVGYGAGAWGFDGPRLARFRERIGTPGDFKALSEALAAARAVGCEMGEPDLARLPKGFEAEGEAAVLLRHKSAVARTLKGGASPSVLMGTDAADWVMAQTKALLPLIRWVKDL